jgi:hypothetical protein
VAGASAGLELDRAAVAAGELWRVMSGHCTHWTLAQLFWDGVVFAALGCLCWSEDRGLFWRTLVASALAVSVAVLWLQPEIGSYRGLSGIDAALFAALTTTATRSLWRRQRFRAALGVGAARRRSSASRRAVAGAGGFGGRKSGRRLRAAAAACRERGSRDGRRGEVSADP